MKTYTLPLVFLLIFSALVLPSVSAEEPVEGRAGRAEVRFLEGMTDHHQMALDMAKDCLAKAESENLQALCQNIIDAQSAEIETMTGWLLDWYNIAYEPVPMTTMDGMDHGDMVMGDQPFTDPAMMMGMMAGFNRLEGVDYEIAWLESMIDHHDDALHMAERVLQRAEHPDLITMAEAIITAQSAEIQMMEEMILSLVGE